MRNFIHLEDGTEIEISKETAENVRKSQEKPEKRHGNYGYDFRDEPCVRIYLPIQHGPLTVADKQRTYGSDVGVVAVPKVILGNIFDELEAMKEDKSYFEVSDKDGTLAIHAGLNGCWIEIVTNVKHQRFTLKQTEKLSLGLRHLIATAKRRKADC